MGKLSKKLVSIVTATIVISSLAFTSLPAIEAKAVTTVSTSSTVPYEDSMATELKDQVESYSVTNYGLTEKTKDGAILHAFCWSFASIKSNLADIAEAGYSTVQTSPANSIYDSSPGMKIMTDPNDNSNGSQGVWWWHYQPTDWKIGNYQLGSREEFKELCSEADKYGIKIIVDVLPNHTATDTSKVSQDLKNAAGGDLYHANGFKLIQNNGDWSWGNRLACTTGMMGNLPDVNTENKGFQEYYMKYVNDIIACGGDGFRYDTAKHIGVPSDPKDPKSPENDFWPVVTGKKSVNGVSLTNNGNLFIYGEILQDNGIPYQEYASYMEMTASEYGGKLRSAINSKNFSTGNLSNWNHITPDKIVTWVESHDTYFNEGPSRGMSDWDIKMTWAVLAARSQGTPLFMSRPDGSSRSNYLGNNVLGAKGNDHFKDPEVAAANKFRNAMVGQPDYMRNPNGNSQILQIDRGTKGTCIINLGGDTSINNDTTMANGTYKDTVTGGTFTVSGGKISGQLKGGTVHTIYDPGSITPITKDPTVGSSVQTGSSFTSDSLELTLSTTNSTSATYSIDGGSATTYTNGQKIPVGQNTPVGGTVKVVLNAIGTDNKTATATFTYTKKEKVKENAGLYFTKPSGWGAPTVYVYDDSTATAQKNAAWPGTAMTDLGSGVYYYEVPANLAKAKVIFVSGGSQFPGSQQPGHAYTTGTILRCDGSTWAEEQVEIVIPDEELVAGTISTSAQSSQVGFAPITISTSEATGGSGAKTYKIAVGSVTIGTSTSATWTPTTVGNHIITVTSTDAKGKTVTATKTFVIEETPIEELTLDSFKANVASPQQVGASIKLGAVATGEGTLEYKFEATLNGKTTVLSGYSDSNTVSWKPTQEGIYNIKASVTDLTGNTDTKTISYKITGSPVALKGFTASLASPQNAGTAITLSATGTGSGALRYKFLVISGSTNTVVKDYSTTNTAVWKPTKAGTYTVIVGLRDASGKAVTKRMTYVIKAQAPVTITKISTDKASPQNAGTAITLSATGTGSGALRYKFLVISGSTNTVVKDYSTTNTAVWKPTKAGTYTVIVGLRDASGKAATKRMTYVIKDQAPVTITKISTDKVSPQPAGTSIKITATGVSSSKSALTYKFTVNEGLAGFKTISNFSSLNTATWKPTGTGVCTIFVEAKDALGNRAIETITYNVTASVTTISNTNTKIKYTGSWKTNTTSHYTNAEYAEMAFSFTGTEIKFISQKGTNKGIALVTVDGGEPIEVDLYSAKATTAGEVVFSVAGLSATQTHTISIVSLGVSNGDATDSIIKIESFQITSGTIK